MAKNVLDDIINQNRNTGNGNRPNGQAPQSGARQVFDEDGNPIKSGQYTQKRFDANGRELPESRAWINVGRVQLLPDAQGNQVKRFVNVASGIPVDSIPLFKASPNNKLRQKQNKERANLLALVEEMQPGEERILNYQVRIRKVFDQSAIELAAEGDDDDGFQLSSPVNDYEEESFEEGHD